MRSREHGSMLLLLMVAIATSAAPFLRGVISTERPLAAGLAVTGLAADYVVDAAGQRVAIGDYRRIASCSSIADAVLPDLVASERLVAVTRWFVTDNPDAARVAHLPRLSGPEEVEKLVALHPDLVIVSNFSGDDSPLARLREQGLAVFDLGHMSGRATFEKNLRDLAQLLGQAGRGERLARAFQRRLDQVSIHVPQAQRKRAMYLNLYDTQLSGGTVGSSYHDVLTAAGLIDVAARRGTSGIAKEQAYPRYRIEDVLAMNPDILVTVRGKGKAICEVPGLQTIAPCRSSLGIIELDEQRLNDPGPGMLATAEEICDRVYPKSF